MFIGCIFPAAAGRYVYDSILRAHREDLPLRPRVGYSSSVAGRLPVAYLFQVSSRAVFHTNSHIRTIVDPALPAVSHEPQNAGATANLDLDNLRTSRH